MTWTVTKPSGDTMKVERVTDRARNLVSGSTFQDSKTVVRTLTVHDTVYVERRDSVMVEKEIAGRARNEGSPKPSSLNLTLRWIFWILCAIIALVITMKILWRRGS